MAHFPKDQYQTSTINLDDAIWGTGGFVKSSAKERKKECSWSSFVLDENAAVVKAWDLNEKSAAVIVLDTKNRVQFVKEGALSINEITEVVDLINNMIM